MTLAFRRSGVRATLLLAVLAMAVPPPASAEVPVSVLDALGLARPTERAAAPSFALPGLDGGSVSLAGARGQGLLLYFWATW